MTLETGESATPPERSRPSRSIGQNVGALLSSQLLTWTLATITVWLVPRYLGATSFGELRLANSIWLIASVLAMFGTSTLMTVEVARHREAARSLVSRVIRFRLVGFAVVLPFVVAVLVLGSYSRTTIEVTAILGLAALFSLIGVAYDSGLHGLQEMGQTARVTVISKTLRSAAILLVLLLGGGLLP